MSNFTHLAKAELRGTLRKYFLMHVREMELKQSEYIRGLIRQDLMKHYPGLKPTGKIKPPIKNE